MKNARPDNHGSDDGTQQAIDALHDVDFNALSFVQLKRLNSALVDATRRIEAETTRRADSDAQGDTVRVAVPPSLDR
ncbi:MAG TPA: hypothetical protein VGA68_11525 [Woeseiaceae bacterium]|jgi:hypothetical protein